MKIQEIIRQECMPRRDCMLTVQDTSGEAGFLYFKDSELIEANCANRWGQDALARVAEWQIAEYFVAPLPLGIKRSLWGTVDSLFRGKGEERTPVSTSKGRPLPTSDEDESFVDSAPAPASNLPYGEFRDIAGLVQLGLFQKDEYQVVHNNYPDEPTSVPEWLQQFLKKANGLGEMIGFGRITEVGIATDLVHVVGFNQNNGVLLVVRHHEASLDELESACRHLLQPSRSS